jgi:hypothetical protein
MNATHSKRNNVVLEPLQRATLQHIDSIKPVDDDDYNVLSAIHEVLVKYGATTRFGVCLLHNHFVVADDETLMEYTDEDSRTQKIVVEPLSQNQGVNVIETMFRFGETIGVKMRCVQRCQGFGMTGHKHTHDKR